MDRLGNALAQLADRKAEEFAKEYESHFHARADAISTHPDWPKLSDEDKQFILNTFGLVLAQSASSFNRRVKRQVDSFPIAILVMGRVRHDLPCKQRQRVAQKMLEDSKHSLLDVNSLKVLNQFRDDSQAASLDWVSSFFACFEKNVAGRCSRKRTPEQAVETVWRTGPKLLPGALVYRLGTAGNREFSDPTRPEKKAPRTWTRVRPLAATGLVGSLLSKQVRKHSFRRRCLSLGRSVSAENNGLFAKRNRCLVSGVHYSRWSGHWLFFFLPYLGGLVFGRKLECLTLVSQKHKALQACLLSCARLAKPCNK